MLNGHGRVLVALLIAALIVVVIWLFPSGASSAGVDGDNSFSWPLASTVTAGDVQGYIERWLTDGCSRRKNRHGEEACREVALSQTRGRRAPELAQLIVEIALERDVDPYVVAVVVAHESSFNERVSRGSVGERGLMQVHGLALQRAHARGHDLDTSEGQLAAGTDYLASCAERCGPSLVGVLSGYQAGRCSTKAHGPRLRARRVRAERARHMERLVARSSSGPRCI